MNELLTTDGPRALSMTDEELIAVLKSSLYPGAADSSVKMVLGYCRASGLDVMQKPVHIVPMKVKTGRKDGRGYDETELRDVVMPGIGLYRVQASRTAQLAGIDEPEFGPDMPMPGNPAKVVPQWCRVTVYRVIGGQARAFTAREFWVENYATAGRDSIAPNAMWTRRPYGQIAKCAEAQALRKAFPELGSQPTADETIVEQEEIDVTPAAPVSTAPKVARKVAAIAKPEPAEVEIPTVVGEREPIEAERVHEPAIHPAGAHAPSPSQHPPAKPATTAPGTIGKGEIAYLKNKATAVGVPIESVLADCGGLVLEAMSREDFEVVKKHIRSLES